MSTVDGIIDAESVWSEDISIRKMCMKKYMALSHTYLWSFVIPGQYQWAGTTQELRENYEVQALINSKQTRLWAVNSNFDKEWKEFDFPDWPKKPVECISDYSVSHQRPRALEHMTKALTGQAYSKQMRATMKNTHYGELLAFEQDEVKAMNLGDSVQGGINLGKLRELGPMSPVEREVAAHTRMICRRGMEIDAEYIEKCRVALEYIRHDQQKLLPWVAGGDSPMSVQGFNTWCCRHNVAPPNNLRKGDSDFADWMAANPELAPTLKARQRYELANRKISHIGKFLSRVHEGRYYPDILYCGAAHTRRFSAKGSSDGSQGDETHSGFNIQNMDREPLFGDLLPDFTSPLPPAHGPQFGVFFRNFLVPPPGKKFLILDFAQIEPRCLYWLAGCEQLLQMIREGFSIYEAFARSVGMWNEPGKLKETAPTPYYVKVKNAAIGSGYGMGGPKFANYAKIPIDEATELIQLIRTNNPKVPDFWKMLQRLTVDAGRSGDPLQVTMPNGSLFQYFNVRQYDRPDTQGGVRICYKADKVLCDPNPKNTGDIYGGRLTENVTQRMARDLMAEAVLRLERAGLKVAFHAHDEIIAEVDADNAQDAYREGMEIMKQVPDWAYGLPIGVSGGIYDRYCKAD